MIFGTVGTHTAPFDRLVEALDDLAAVIPERVVIQTGSSRHILRAAVGLSLISSHEFAGYMREARVVVSQGGDTVLEAIELGVPLVVVPRRHAHGECIDDHQVELAEALAARGLATWAEPELLAEAIAHAKATTERLHPAELVDAIRSALDR